MTIVGAEILHLVKVVVVMLKPNVNGMILQRKNFREQKIN